MILCTADKNSEIFFIKEVDSSKRIRSMIEKNHSKTKIQDLTLEGFKNLGFFVNNNLKNIYSVYLYEICET